MLLLLRLQSPGTVAYQGAAVKVGTPAPIFDLIPPNRPDITQESEREGLALVNRLKRQHAASREADSCLQAQIASYEMAARVTISAPEVMNLSEESAATHSLYGLHW